MNQPLAYIHPQAKIARNAVIEPFATISKNVVIGEGSWIGSNVTIMEGARIGKNVKIFPGAVVSAIPQDLKFGGEETTFEIGDNTVIRECCTLNRGTHATNKTVIGKDCLVMAYTHVAHDCMVGNHCIMANNASIAGHVHVGDHVIIGGMSGVHQFCHIGDHSFVAANALVLKDIPAYVMASGHPAKPFGLNSEGLKRRGFSSDIIMSIKRAYKEVYRKKQSVEEALSVIAASDDSSPALDLFTNSISQSTRGIIR